MSVTGSDGSSSSVGGDQGDWTSQMQDLEFEDGPGTFFVRGERAYNNTYWPYRMPADQQESLRQDHQHHLFNVELPGLYRDPVADVLEGNERLKRILDIGCGTGMWLAEMAEIFPHVDCVGIDIIAQQHDHQHPNCTFTFVEAPRGMKIFPDEAFDVIQIRQMMYSIAEYQQVLCEAYRVLRRGGVLLVHEVARDLVCGWEGKTASEIAPNMDRWFRLTDNAMSRRGIDMSLFESMMDALARAGFDTDEVDEYQYFWQFCSLAIPGQVEHTLSFVEAVRLLVLEGGEMDNDEYSALFAAICNEIRDDPPQGIDSLMGRWGYWWVMK